MRYYKTVQKRSTIVRIYVLTQNRKTDKVEINKLLITVTY